MKLAGDAEEQIVFRTFVEEIHQENYRFADSAHSELHVVVRRRIQKQALNAANAPVEAKALAGKLREMAGSEGAGKVIRKNMLRQVIELLWGI